MPYPKAKWNSEAPPTMQSLCLGWMILWHTRRLLKHWTQLCEISRTAIKSWEAFVSSWLAISLRPPQCQIQRGSAADEINACFKMSKLWRTVHKLKWTKNMRVLTSDDTLAEDFSNKLLQIGNGQITPDVSGQVKLPEDFCVTVLNSRELNDEVYPDIENKCVLHANYFNWLCERAILAPRIDNVNQINLDILKELPGDIASFTSYNKTLEDEDTIRFPTDFLNSQESLECFSTSSSSRLDLRLFCSEISMHRSFATVYDCVWKVWSQTWLKLLFWRDATKALKFSFHG